MLFLSQEMEVKFLKLKLMNSEFHARRTLGFVVKT